MTIEKNEQVMCAKRARGVGCGFFGSILLFTGILNSMVALKGGIPTGPLDYALLISGGALMLIGRLRR